MKHPAISAAAPWELERSKLAKFQQSGAYDLLMRVPLLSWSVFCAIVQVASLDGYLRQVDPALPSGVWAINMAMRVSTIAFLLLVAAAVILRARPAGKARGIEPRISAFMGAFLVYAIPLCPRRELSLAAEIVSTVLILLGSAGAVFALLQLGHSFSMMAEARRIVTMGVYRWVRHPLYLAEELATIGIFMQFLSVWTALLLALQIAFQLRRMHNEEMVLAQTFPEYAAYKAKTARLMPGLF